MLRVKNVPTAEIFKKTRFPENSRPICEEVTHRTVMPFLCSRPFSSSPTATHSSCSGYYCDRSDGPISDYTLYDCPLGYYCPEGTRMMNEFGCPNGTYGEGLNFQNATSCSQCDPGKYCSPEGRTKSEWTEIFDDTKRARVKMREITSVVDSVSLYAAHNDFSNKVHNADIVKTCNGPEHL